MALKDTDASAEYPYIFMVEQSIHQRTFENENETPHYTLSIVWTYYKVDGNGDVTFDPDGQYSYYDENFYLSAAIDIQGGNNTHFNTLTAQTGSIKQIVEQETGLTLEIV